MDAKPPWWDVLIIGGGPAGLSAALLLARACRRVIVLDAGQPRNRRSNQLGGFLSRDRSSPAALLDLARAELRAYDTVELRARTEVTDAEAVQGGFKVTIADGESFSGRKVLIATGVTDALPPLPGIDAFYGRSVWHCPYCDGYEYRGRPIAVYGADKAAQKLALELTGWTPRITLVSGGSCQLDEPERQRLARNGIGIRQERIIQLQGDGRLERIVFASGESLVADALFFQSAGTPASKIATCLGVSPGRSGFFETASYGKTDIGGVFVAGDEVRHVQLAIVAAGEGAAAAFAINTELIKEALA